MKYKFYFLLIIPSLISCQVKSDIDISKVARDPLYHEFYLKFHEFFLYGTNNEYNDQDLGTATAEISRMTQEEVCSKLSSFNFNRFKGIQKHFELDCEVYFARKKLVEKYSSDFNEHSVEIMKEYKRVNKNDKK